MTLKIINNQNGGQRGRGQIIQLKKLSICLIPATALSVFGTVLKKDEIFSLGSFAPCCISGSQDF
jgi:hypothetical protein